MNRTVQLEARFHEPEGRVRFHNGPTYYVSNEKDLTNLFEKLWRELRDEDRHRILKRFQRWQKRRAARAPRTAALLRIYGLG
jgi:hypothetical protein